MAKQSSEDLVLLAALLDDIEQELRRLGYWHGEVGRPEAKAFASAIPFCLDTMQFHQWLEYVLIAKLRALLRAGSPLPERMQIAPMAQEFWRGRWNEHRQLIALLKRLDGRFKD